MGAVDRFILFFGGGACAVVAGDAVGQGNFQLAAAGIYVALAALLALVGSRFFG